MNRDGLEEEKFCEDNENCIEFLKGKMLSVVRNGEDRDFFQDAFCVVVGGLNDYLPYMRQVSRLARTNEKSQ
jgi:hypothetical protein